MGLSESLDVVSDVLDGYRSRGRAVRRVDVTTAEADGAALGVTLDVPVSLCASADGRPAPSPRAATLTDDGLRVDYVAEELAPVPLTDDRIVSTNERSVRVTDDDLVLTLELTVDPTEGGDDGTDDASAAVGDGAGRPERGPDDGGGGSTGHEASARLAAARDESVPPYEDTEYLRLLYDSCDSFAEMSREIPMDVSSETVRRYMIEADVHDPATYDTSTAADASDDPAAASPAADDPVSDVPEEQLLTDGVGLPADLDLEDVADAVVDSRTTYEVHTHLGIGQERTRELLKQLGLLDLVLRRVGGDPDRRVSYEEVTARIRQRVPPDA